MKKTLGTGTALLLACVIPAALGAHALAAIPRTINYQGRLTTNDALPSPVNGNLPMQFSLWDDVVGGTLLWSESWPSVPVSEGIFNLVLGSLTPLPSSLFQSGDRRWLELSVNGEVLSPRQELTSTGWAFQAEGTNTLGGLPASSWQRRVTGTCPSGSSIQAVGDQGTVTCEVDDTGAGVPSGAIMYFNNSTCPPGWSPLVAAQGRYLVGVVPGGTLLGTPTGVHSALFDRENRPVGAHSHGITDPGHRHGYEAAVPTSTGSGDSQAGYEHRNTDLAVTNVTINSTGPAGTNAPYIQLLVCQKN
ncbi:MAG: hypothetical protein ACREAA_19885 [Candidatus Polarisedimenticolia bacterium]